MRVFLDTNILLDIVEQRMPHYPASQAVLDKCDQRGFEIFIAWHGLATVLYITAKKRGAPYAMEMIRELLTWATVATVGQGEALEAFGYGIADYEDALIAAAASAASSDWLITRDEVGFSRGPSPAISPNDFIRKIEQLV